jgi:WD40 repeat protein
MAITAKIWNVANNLTSPTLTLYGHANALLGVAFRPDKARFVTASHDSTARVYSLKIEDLAALAKHRVIRSLTNEECQQYLHMDTYP